MVEKPVEVALVVASTIPCGPDAPIAPPAVVEIVGAWLGPARCCQLVPSRETHVPAFPPRSAPTATICVPSESSAGPVSVLANGKLDALTGAQVRPSPEAQNVSDPPVIPTATRTHRAARARGRATYTRRPVL